MTPILRRLIHTIKLKLDDINLLVSLNFKGSATAAQRYPRSSTLSRTELDGAENPGQRDIPRKTLCLLVRVNLRRN